MEMEWFEVLHWFCEASNLQTAKARFEIDIAQIGKF